MYEDYNFSDTTEYANNTEPVLLSINDENSQVEIDEATGMRIVERGPKRHKNTTAGHHIGLGTIVLLFFGATFIVTGIGLLISGFVSLINGDIETFAALFFTSIFMLPFGLVPGAIAFGTIKKNKENNDILKNGYYAKLPISNIIFTNSYLNEIPGYKIELINPNHKKGFLHTYRSETLYTEEVEWLKEGDLMPIYVHKIDPTKFYMDLEGAVFEKKRKENEEALKNVQ